MKRKLFIPLFTITLLLLGSCSKEELNQKVQMQSITLKASTRSPDGNNEDVWRNGDKIAVFAQHYQAKYFQFDELSWQLTDGEAFYGEVPGVFFGVSPASMNSGFTIPTDQSTVEKLRAADYMSSDNVELTDNKQTLDLVFKHRLARVEITITEYKNEFGGTIPTVVSPKFSGYTSVAREDDDGSTMLPTQSLKNITPLFTEDNSQGKHKFEVLIAPGDYEKKFTCEVNGVELSSTLPPNLDEGKTYRFNLTVGKDVIKLNTPQITDFVTGWNDELAIDYAPPKVGDYLYSDGKWGPMDKSKNPVGVIFSTQTSETDKSAGYHNGYAISMAFVQGKFEYEKKHTLTGAEVFYKFLSWEKKVANKDGRTETLALNNSNHPAIQAALSYQPPFTIGATPGTSEWFVPSLGQVYDIFVNLIGLPSTPSQIAYGQLKSYNNQFEAEGIRANKYFSDWEKPEYNNIAEAYGNDGKYWWTSTRFYEIREFFIVQAFWKDGWNIIYASGNALYVRPAIAF